MLWLILVITALVAFYIYKSRTIDYWRDSGIPNIKPYPFVGNMGRMIFQRKAIVSLLSDMYTQYPDAKYIGCMNFNKPYLVVKDPEVMKMITVKDFDHFINHQSVLSEDIDPLFGKSLVSLQDQRWKDMRSTMSPSFSSSKMRAMFVLMTESGEQFVDYFINKIKTQNNEPLIIEMKDVFSRFTNDVIATTAFGLKVDSFLHPKNDFYMTGKKIFNNSFTTILTVIGYNLFPRLMKKLKIPLFSNSLTQFFKSIVQETMEVRERENIFRPDMIQLLMEAKKGQLRHEAASEDEKKVSDTGFATVEESNIGKTVRANKTPLTDEDLFAQAFIFFGAGFDTSSTAMSFTVHEIAVNPDIQVRLQAEIDEVLEEYNGKLTYEALNSMKYLDMVICESLRKWPPATLVDRLCGKKYTLPGPYSKNNDEKTFSIDRGVGIWLPIHAIHHDPKYYPNPDKFDPERFNDENKRKINPFTYIPFGVGPRGCIGSRFALLQVKIGLFYLLSKFEFAVCNKTKIPFELKQTTFVLSVKGGFWLEMKPRSTTQL